jgi:hypothetical protein
MKALPKDLAEALQSAGYDRASFRPRRINRLVTDPDGAILLDDQGKAQIDSIEVQDLHVSPGALRDNATGNWPAIDILGKAGARFDEAAEVCDGTLRLRNLTLTDVQLQAAE